VGDRLRSLQSELVNAETRWRARGDGMRQKPQDEAAAKASSIEGIGGLVSRLKVCALFAQYHQIAILDVDLPLAVIGGLAFSRPLVRACVP
jgi:hypothetical protein